MTITVPFSTSATIEQRKHAINTALEPHAPISIQSMELDIPNIGSTPYTGGFLQMNLARQCTVKFRRL